MVTTAPQHEQTKLVYLEEIHESLRDIDKISYRLYHIIGVFKYEESFGKDVHIWNLIDETCPDGLKVCIRGPYNFYPKPKTGDIVRIHRIRLKIGQQYPECPHPGNVVLWRSLVKPGSCQHESAAKSPTITPAELERREQLESFIPYTKISNIYYLNTDHIDIAGQIVASNTCDGIYQNHVLQLIDGSQRTNSWESFYQDKLLTPRNLCDTITVKVYSKQTAYDTDDHINVARALKEGDLVYMTNVKMIKINNKIKLELGSNHKFGKCLRNVDPLSLFGRIILMNLKRIEPDIYEDCFSDDSSQTTEIFNNINDPEVDAALTSTQNVSPELAAQDPEELQSTVQNETNNSVHDAPFESDQSASNEGVANISNSIFNDSILSTEEVSVPTQSVPNVDNNTEPVPETIQISQPRPTTRQLLKLEVVVRSLREKETSKLADVFGVFVFEDLLSQTCRIWKLMDESCPEGIKIRLVGTHQPFPKPLSGDVIRIHRLDIKYGTAYPECSNPANIVVWPGFQVPDSPHISVSRFPTITHDDLLRKADLEQFFSFTRIEDIGPGNSTHVNLAGKIIAMNPCDESYGNFLLQIFDGSKFRIPLQCMFSELIDPKPNVDKRILDNSLIVKIYSKQRSSDTDAHVNTAKTLKVNDFVYIANARMTWVSGRIKLELSSNLLFGKCVRLIDKRSIVGERISRDVDILCFNEVEMLELDSLEESLSRTSTVTSNNSNISDYSNLSNYGDCVGT